MTYDEALHEIGVAPGSGQDEIRRSYLRLVKIRKPESDPEGFRRLREAFERLREEPEPSPESLFQPVPASRQPDGPTADTQAFDAFAFEPEQIEAAESPEELRAAADAALRVLQTAGERRVFPHPFPFLFLLLRLQAQGHANEAVRVQEAFRSFLASSGQELTLLDGWTAVLWQVAQEMSRLSPEFPSPARAAIGESIAAGAPEAAIPELDRVVTEDGDVGWRMASELKELPGLHGLYHQAILAALARRSPRVVQEEISSPWHAGELSRWVFGGFWVLFLLVKNCSTPAPSVPAAPYLGDSFPFVSLEQALLVACSSETVPTLGQSVLCRAARDAATGLRQRRCYDVRATRGQLLEGLQMVQGTAGAPAATTLVASIRTEYAAVCRDVF